MLGRPGCLWVEFRRLHYCLIKANVFPNRDNDRTSLKPISSAKESVNFPLEGLCCLRPSQSIYSILCHSGLSIRVTTSAQTNSRIHHAKGPLTPRRCRDHATATRAPFSKFGGEGHATVRQEDDFYPIGCGPGRRRYSSWGLPPRLRTISTTSRLAASTQSGSRPRTTRLVPKLPSFSQG